MPQGVEENQRNLRRPYHSDYPSCWAKGVPDSDSNLWHSRLQLRSSSRYLHFWRFYWWVDSFSLLLLDQCSIQARECWIQSWSWTGWEILKRVFRWWIQSGHCIFESNQWSLPDQWRRSQTQGWISCQRIVPSRRTSKLWNEFLDFICICLGNQKRLHWRYFQSHR